MNLIEGIHEEIDRCRTVIGYYKEVGPSGAFGAMMMEQDISRARTAIAEGDTVAMVRCLAALKAVEA